MRKLEGMKVVTGYPVLYGPKQTPVPLELKKEDFLYLGKDVCIWPQAKIVNSQKVSVGHKSMIDDFTFIFAGEQPIYIGRFVHISGNCSITGGGGLTMEDFSGISHGVRIMTSDEDFSEGTSLTNPTIPPEFRTAISARVIIKKYVLVGCNSVILPGITVGEGCAVGSLSLVARDLPPWTVCAGWPARPVKKRPSQKVLELGERLLLKYPQYQEV
jgi:galactoside O-acetyltransferase